MNHFDDDIIKKEDIVEIDLYKSTFIQKKKTLLALILCRSGKNILSNVQVSQYLHKIHSVPWPPM